MRAGTFVSRVVWLVVLAFAGYAVIAAGSSYFQVRSLVDQAVDAGSRGGRPARGRPAGIRHRHPHGPPARRSPGRIRPSAAEALDRTPRRGDTSQVPLELRPVDRGRRGGPRFPALDRPDVHAENVIDHQSSPSMASVDWSYHRSG